MGTESIEASFLSIFALISFFILIISKFSYKIRGGALLDKEFSKPQVFHEIIDMNKINVNYLIECFFYIYYLYIR